MREFDEIEKIIEKEIRPMIQNHGGDVKLKDFIDGTAIIELSGACAGCPSADLSTTGYIEDVLTAALAYVKSVEIDKIIPEDMLEMARKILSGKVKK